MSLVLLLIVAATASAPTPSGVVQITSSNELDAAMASSASLVVALLPARCDNCRQVAANLEWAAKELATNNLLSAVTIAKVSETALSTRDWHHVLQRFGVARALVDDVASAAAVKWLPSPHLVQRRGISQEGEGMGEEGWGRQDKQLIHECDQISSANGLYDYIRGAMAAKEVVSGQDSCDACRRVLEAMHYDWHQLLRRLDSVQALHIDANWQATIIRADAQETHQAIMAVCTSPYMMQLSNSTRHTAALLFKWHGDKFVARHLQLFTSWCKRSGDAGLPLTRAKLLQCAGQWAHKVPNGRLGLHEKNMGACSSGTGGVAKVCAFEGSGWQATKRLPASRQIRPTKASR
mmetsp:Transcript_14998/g.21850  ORF Transcript_14998/g.21850 Transcript_14998/m.21850 type:complete len:350 (+) Transcript_14998:1-1050(+)